MTLPPAVANSAWIASNLPAWIRYRRALACSELAQRSILLRLLRRNAASSYGRTHDFASISTVEEYQQRVPILSPDDLAPWTDRIKRGERSVLTTEPVTHLVPTSGSTGGRKLIPFTASFQRELTAAIGPWIVDLCRRQPAVAAGSSYWSISPISSPPSAEVSAVPIGFDDDSEYLGGFRRRLVESAFAVPSSVRHAPDLATFHYVTLLCLLRRSDLALISVWHPSFLTLLFDALPAQWNNLLADVRDGTCSVADPLGRKMMGHPDPNRAKALAKSQPDDPLGLWPHLRHVSCWADAQAAIAFEHLRSRFPKKILHPKGLLATEAFVSIPFQGLRPLAVTSHYFEFRETSGAIRQAHELTVGEVYSLIVTTGAGLWRYDLGDEIEVTGFVRATPSIRFLGRTGNVSDLCGEKLTEAFVTHAISKACKTLRFTPSFVVLAPTSPSSPPRSYTLFVEGEFSAELPATLDQELSANPHYALCRTLGQLTSVHCRKIPSGSGAKWLAARAAAGQSLGEIKPPMLSQSSHWEAFFAPSP